MRMMPRPAVRTSATRQRGSATVEVAVVLPSVVLAFLAGVWGIGAASAQLRCVDAAREVARAVARGEDVGSAKALAAPIAVGGSRVEVSESTGLVRVTVRAPVHLPGPAGRWWPTVEVSGVATTATER